MEAQSHKQPAQAPRREPVGASLWLAGLAAVVTIAGLLTMAGPAHAQSITDLQSQITAAQGQAQSLASQVQAKTDQLAAAHQQAAAAAARELQLSTALAAGQQREAELQTQVSQTHDQLVRARAQLRRALKALSDRLVAIYQGDAPDATSLLLNAHGYDDLATRSDLLGRIQQADQQLAERIRQLRAQVADRLDAVEQARDRQAAYNQQVAAARDQAASVRANAESAAAALEQARAEQAAAIESLRSQIGGWTTEVEQLQAAQAQAASQETASQEVSSWVGDWAIPSAIVNCESGGNWSAVNPSSGAGGAYQILPSTWRLYGGSGAPQDASPAEQSRIAAQIWADSGPGAWECAL
jgi:predicted  nucleic acid-binding Zn-ribbon protein